MYRPKAFDPPWIDFFTSPCPYYRRYHEFTLFPKLPLELQFLIWKYATENESPRTITVKTFVDYSPSTIASLRPILKANAVDIPSILSACHDSRRVAKKAYKLMLGLQLNHPIYLDISKDTFLLSGTNTKRLFKLRCEPPRGVPAKRLNLEEAAGQPGE